jgi:hypothetical protein
MARSEARLQFGVLEGLHGLSREAKLLYFTVLVEPTVNQAGVGALRDRLWAKRAELTAEETEQALQELDETRYVLVDHDTEEVFVRTLIRNDGVAERPNVLWSACRAALQVRSPKLRRELAEELRKLPPRPPDKVTKSGGTYAHPDPHSVADKIDPAPQPDPGERFDNPSATLPQNGSTTLPQPSLVEPFENPSRTPGGGGGGGGEGSTPVATQVSESKSFAAQPVDQPAAPAVVTTASGDAADDQPKRGKRIPDDFTVTPAMVTWAREHTPRVDGRRETERFIDHWQAKTGKDATKRDWIATWRNWMRGAEDRLPNYNQPNKPGRSPSRPSTTDQRCADIQALKYPDTTDTPPLRMLLGGAS